jgi:hypothetical protein
MFPTEKMVVVLEHGRFIAPGAGRLPKFAPGYGLVGFPLFNLAPHQPQEFIQLPLCLLVIFSPQQCLGAIGDRLDCGQRVPSQRRGTLDFMDNIGLNWIAPPTVVTAEVRGIVPWTLGAIKHLKHRPTALTFHNHRSLHFKTSMRSG